MNVSIRPAEKADIDCLYEAYNNQDYNSKGMYIGHIDKKYFYDLYERSGFFSDSLKYFIVHSGEKKVGVLTLKVSHPTLKTLEVGFWIFAPENRGKGLGKSALMKLLEYHFNSHSNPRLQAIVDGDNVPAIRLLESCCFKCEGVMRKAAWSSGKYVDCCMYSITRDEWSDL